jgi:hypothetical protein
MENEPLTIGLLALFALSLISVAIYYLPLPLEFLIYIRLIRATVIV